MPLLVIIMCSRQLRASPHTCPGQSPRETAGCQEADGGSKGRARGLLGGFGVILVGRGSLLLMCCCLILPFTSFLERSGQRPGVYSLCSLWAPPFLFPLEEEGLPRLPINSVFLLLGFFSFLFFFSFGDSGESSSRFQFLIRTLAKDATCVSICLAH